MAVRFPLEEVPAIAARYNIKSIERAIADSVPIVQEQQHLTRDQLLLLCQWKSPRRADRAKVNSPLFVREIAGFALASTDERARIEPLCLLDGVEWPTASTVLHWFHPEPYPILDFRALWSLTLDQPGNYSFVFWDEYLDQWRDTLTEARQLLGHAVVTPRILDRALWQYSWENQPRNGRV